MLLDLKQMFNQHQLTLRGVIHVGPHQSTDLAHYAEMGAREVALFEPLPEHRWRTAQNMAAMQRQPNAPRIDFYPLALGSVHQQRPKAETDTQGQSQSLATTQENPRQGSRSDSADSEMICIARMDHILTQPERYNLLRIDGHPGELDVLKGAGETILRTLEVICCRVTRGQPDPESEPANAIDSYLQRFGFTKLSTRWGASDWGTAFYGRESRQMPPTETQAPKHQSAQERFGRFCRTHGIDLDLASGRRLIRKVNMQDRCQLINAGEASTNAAEPTLDALKVARMGRYSNNIIQILHSTLVAKKLGVEKIILPAAFADLREVSTTIGGLRFIQQGQPSSHTERQLESYFWFPSGSLQALFQGITVKHANQVVSSVVKPIFYQFFPFSTSSEPTWADGKRTLAAHIRSGDLFRSTTAAPAPVAPHPFYVQPPLSFYQIAIEDAMSRQTEASRVLLVIEDRKNPVVTGLCDWLEEKKLDFQIIDGDFQEAIQTMLAAQVIVSAYGSVIEMIGMLSEQLEAVYAFRGYGRWAEKEIAGHANYHLLGKEKRIHTLTLEDHYIEPGHWQDTPAQKHLMLSYKATITALQTSTPTEGPAAAASPFFLFS